jgi:hypothetical protein
MPVINGTKTTYINLIQTLRRDGIDIRRNDFGEYQIKRVDWSWCDARAYFTSNIEDAYNTAQRFIFDMSAKEIKTVDNVAIEFLNVNSPAYDRFNEAYCAALLSTKTNSPERVWIVENAKAFELVFFAGYNAKGGK